MKPKAETSKVTNNVNTAILPADPLDGALRADNENVVARNEHHAPSGNVFFVGKDDLQVVISDKSPIKLCSYIDVEPKATIGGAAVGVDWFGLPTPSGRFVRQQ